jgi:hypothetical protein
MARRNAFLGTISSPYSFFQHMRERYHKLHNNPLHRIDEQIQSLRDVSLMQDSDSTQATFPKARHHQTLFFWYFSFSYYAVSCNLYFNSFRFTKIIMSTIREIRFMHKEMVSSYVQLNPKKKYLIYFCQWRAWLFPSIVMNNCLVQILLQI